MVVHGSGERSKTYVQHVCTDVSRSRGGDLQEVPVVAMAVLIDADGPHDALPAAHSGFGCEVSPLPRYSVVPCGARIPNSF